MGTVLAARRGRPEPRRDWRERWRPSRGLAPGAQGMGGPGQRAEMSALGRGHRDVDFNFPDCTMGGRRGPRAPRGRGEKLGAEGVSPPPFLCTAADPRGTAPFPHFRRPRACFLPRDLCPFSAGIPDCSPPAPAVRSSMSLPSPVGLPRVSGPGPAIDGSWAHSGPGRWGAVGGSSSWGGLERLCPWGRNPSRGVRSSSLRQHPLEVPELSQVPDVSWAAGPSP